jgi:hypothetical protein
MAGPISLQLAISGLAQSGEFRALGSIPAGESAEALLALRCLDGGDRVELLVSVVRRRISGSDEVIAETSLHVDRQRMLRLLGAVAELERAVGERGS